MAALVNDNPNQLASKVARTMRAAEGTGPAWGVEIEEARLGYARVSMTIRADMLNGHDGQVAVPPARLGMAGGHPHLPIAHGGMIFALADTAFAYACNGRNLKSVAAYASIAFLDAAQEGEMLVAEAQEAAFAGRSGVYNVSVRGGDGRAVAEFQGLSRSLGVPAIGESE